MRPSLKQALIELCDRIIVVGLMANNKALYARALSLQATLKRHY